EVVTTGEVIEVPVPMITRGEAESLKDELNALLFCEAEDELEDSELNSAESESAAELQVNDGGVQ
ncbi:hypothetical protein N9D38_12325, partial [Rubripirellula sp.]|nr:hypothetical protein [Rubripirellula sp.]